jgi:hypothetical protein
MTWRLSFAGDPSSWKRGIWLVATGKRWSKLFGGEYSFA